MLRKYREILIEVVLIAMFVGFIPELFVGAANDAFGACGFSNDVCNQIKLQSVYKGVGVLVCAIAAVIVSFMASKEFNHVEGK